MDIINYNSTGESSFKIYITTNSSYIIFNNTNYNNITFPRRIIIYDMHFIFYLIYIYHHLFSSYFFCVFYLISYDSINYLFLVLHHIHML